MTYYFRCTSAGPFAPLFTTIHENEAIEMRKHPEYVEVLEDDRTERELLPQAKVGPVARPELKKVPFKGGLVKAVPNKAQ